MLTLLLVLACSDSATDSGARTDQTDSGGDGHAWTAPGDPGPHDAGVTTLEFVDDRGKELTVEVWYPAIAEDGDEPDPYPEIPVAMDAYRQAPAAVGPFPLVAFTHGHVAIRYQSAFLCEHLASHGFVVVSPDHPGDTFLDADTDRLFQIIMERPQDVISSVDRVLELSAQGDPLLGGVTDADTYAILGHSLGSINTMALGGAVVDFEAFVAFCADDANSGYAGCGRIDNVDLDVVDDYVMTNPRAVVSVPMSPGVWYAFGKTGLQSLRQPLVLAGTLDNLLDYDTEELPTFEAMGAPRTLATVDRAGHYSWSDICVILPVWDECGGEADGYIDVDRAQAITRGMVTAWVRGHLAGEQQALDWLEDEKAAWPEVSWTVD